MPPCSLTLLKLWGWEVGFFHWCLAGVGWILPKRFLLLDHPFLSLLVMGSRLCLKIFGIYACWQSQVGDLCLECTRGNRGTQGPPRGCPSRPEGPRKSASLLLPSGSSGSVCRVLSVVFWLWEGRAGREGGRLALAGTGSLTTSGVRGRGQTGFE